MPEMLAGRSNGNHFGIRMTPRETAQLLVWGIDMVEREEARRIADRETRMIEAAAGYE